MGDEIKKTLRLKIRVRNCNIVFEEGMEPGVLGYKDFVFYMKQKEYESPIFIKTLLEYKNDLLNDLLVVDVENLP